MSAACVNADHVAALRPTGADRRSPRPPCSMITPYMQGPNHPVVRVALPVVPVALPVVPSEAERMKCADHMGAFEAMPDPMTTVLTDVSREKRATTILYEHLEPQHQSTPHPNLEIYNMPSSRRPERRKCTYVNIGV